MRHFSQFSVFYFDKTEFQTLAQFAEDSVAAVGDIVRNVTNTLCKSGNSTEENSVAPFYTVEGGDLLWGYNENALLVALQTKLDEFPYSLLKITIPTSIGLQVCTMLFWAELTPFCY